MNDLTIDCELFLIWGKDIMGYINESFESRYSRKKNNVSLNSLFFFIFFSNRNRIKKIFRQCNSLDHPIKFPATLMTIMTVL